MIGCTLQSMCHRRAGQLQRARGRLHGGGGMMFWMGKLNGACTFSCWNIEVGGKIAHSRVLDLVLWYSSSVFHAECTDKSCWWLALKQDMCFAPVTMCLFNRWHSCQGHGNVAGRPHLACSQDGSACIRVVHETCAWKQHSCHGASACGSICVMLRRGFKPLLVPISKACVREAAGQHL